MSESSRREDGQQTKTNIVSWAWKRQQTLSCSLFLACRCSQRPNLSSPAYPFIYWDFFSRFSGGVFPLLFSGLPAPSAMSLLTALSQASCRSCEVWCGHLIFQPRARLHFASRSLARSLACRRGLSRGRFQHALWPIVSQTSPGRFTAPTATGSERAPRRWATPLCTHGRGWPAVFRNARE